MKQTASRMHQGARTSFNTCANFHLAGSGSLQPAYNHTSPELGQIANTAHEESKRRKLALQNYHAHNAILPIPNKATSPGIDPHVLERSAFQA
jgi:hypothetical protein